MLLEVREEEEERKEGEHDEERPQNKDANPYLVVNPNYETNLDNGLIIEMFSWGLLNPNLHVAPAQAQTHHHSVHNNT